jgi:hypothetical protein
LLFCTLNPPTACWWSSAREIDFIRNNVSAANFSE